MEDFWLVIVWRIEDVGTPNWFKLVKWIDILLEFTSNKNNIYSLIDSKFEFLNKNSSFEIQYLKFCLEVCNLNFKTKFKCWICQGNLISILPAISLQQVQCQHLQIIQSYHIAVLHKGAYGFYRVYHYQPCSSHLQ